MAGLSLGMLMAAACSTSVEVDRAESPAVSIPAEGKWRTIKVPPFGNEAEATPSSIVERNGDHRRQIEGRSYHTATALSDGKVLVAGGCFETYLDFSCISGSRANDIYDPRSGVWAKAKPMTKSRAGHTSTLLPDGKVLVVGGDILPSPSNLGTVTAELFNPAAGRSGRWIKISSPSEDLERQNGGAELGSTLFSSHSAALIRGARSGCGANCGKVLLVGRGAAVLFDPKKRRWSPAGGVRPECPARVQWLCTTPRARHTATLLGDGRLLILGIVDSEPTEIYDPAADSWVQAEKQPVATGYGTATLLKDGRVLTLGGFKGGNANLVTKSGTFFKPPGASPKARPAGAWTAAPPLRIARYAHRSVLLDDGRVLVVGGTRPAQGQRIQIHPGNTSAPPVENLRDVELFDPATNAWQETAPMAIGRGGALAFSSNANLGSAAPFAFTATVLNDGRVLVLGGANQSIGEIFTPGSLEGRKSRGQRLNGGGR